ncbi:lipase domain-containing protein [Phthorimaea operculella]|nr:lipase domain-containing protein [Phthorimaea operculella]
MYMYERPVVVRAVRAMRARADEARWASVDALLPDTLRHSLPNLIRIVGDLCFLPSHLTSTDELYVVEHTADAVRRYPVSRAEERVRALRPARLALYAGGWGNAPGDEASRAVVAALRTDHALVLELDTSALRGEYVSAAARVPELTHALAGLVLGAARVGVAPSAVHAVGFSLGAHAAGAAARAVWRAGAGRLGRLTALDPARPCFTRGDTARRWRLARDDAAFVHVVHSSASSLGLARQLGHVDVYVRGAGGGGAGGGGAAALVRAHHAAWRLWARSAGAGGSASSLRGRRCADVSTLRNGTCDDGEYISLGYSISPELRGIFLLEVKDIP